MLSVAVHISELPGKPESKSVAELVKTNLNTVNNPPTC